MASAVTKLHNLTDTTPDRLTWRGESRTPSCPEPIFFQNSATLAFRPGGVAPGPEISLRRQDGVGSTGSRLSPRTGFITKMPSTGVAGTLAVRSPNGEGSCTIRSCRGSLFRDVPERNARRRMSAVRDEAEAAPPGVGKRPCESSAPLGQRAGHLLSLCVCRLPFFR